VDDADRFISTHWSYLDGKDFDRLASTRGSEEEGISGFGLLAEPDMGGARAGERHADSRDSDQGHNPSEPFHSNSG
jgi:hypothetical protein